MGIENARERERINYSGAKVKGVTIFEVEQGQSADKIQRCGSGGRRVTWREEKGQGCCDLRTVRSVRRPPGGAAWRPSRGLGAERGPRPVGPVSRGGDRDEDTGGRRDHSVLEFILETVLKDRVRFGKKEMLF